MEGPRSPFRHAVAYAMGSAGLVAVVLGTFLPWLRSGEVQRNSYASFGVLDRLIGFHGMTELAVRFWPLLGMCCAAVVLATAVMWHRVAVLLALLTAGWSAAVGCAVLLRHGDAGVQVQAVGPAVTVAGDVALVLAAIVLLISLARGPQTQRSRS